MSIAVLGAGAFGTALAVTLARQGGAVRLWARDPAQRAALRAGTCPRLHGVTPPPALTIAETPEPANFTLLAMPMQALAGFLAEHGTALRGRALVGCMKGIDLSSLRGPSQLLEAVTPSPAILTGPSFAADIARGLPTALTLACRDEALGARLQTALSTRALRLYRSTDVAGAELGGALKNVVAIAAGVVIGAGLGDSARAALMTRGFAEMTRFALMRGARAETLAGLSGLGDLVLTCTSAQSRNFRFGQSLGAGSAWDERTTVEGAATARAVAEIARREGLEMPVASMVAALVSGAVSVPDAIAALMGRPLKEE